MKHHTPQFIALVDDAKARITEIRCSQLRELLNNKHPLVLVDVREDHEWATGHIPEAIHLGRGIIERDIQSTISDYTATIIVYCGGGYRSALVADNLQKMGYQNVFSLAGGIRDWIDSGFPLKR